MKYRKINFYKKNEISFMSPIQCHYKLAHTKRQCNFLVSVDIAITITISPPSLTEVNLSHIQSSLIQSHSVSL